jgi:hypothetical protein
MWPALFELPTLGEAALPILGGIGSFLGNLGQTGDPLKALSAGALSAGGSLLGGRALGKYVQNIPSIRMAGDFVDAPAAAGLKGQFLSALPDVATALGQAGGAKLGQVASDVVTGALPSFGQLTGAVGATKNALTPKQAPYTGLYPQYANQLPGMVNQYGGANVIDVNNPFGQYQGQLAWQQLQNAQALDYMKQLGAAGSEQALQNKYRDMPLELAGQKARANLLLQTTMMPNAQQNAANLANTGLQGVMQSAVQRGGYV